MLQNEFAKYVKDYVNSKFTTLGVKNDRAKVKPEAYIEFLTKYFDVDEKYLNDFYYEFGLTHTDINVSQDIIDHVIEAKRINVKAVTDTNKIIQYYLARAYFKSIKDYENADKINEDDIDNKLSDTLSGDDLYNVYYNAYKNSRSCSKMCDIYRDIYKGKYNTDLVSSELIDETISQTISEMKVELDKLMKDRLIKLMEHTGITNYELTQLKITEVIPNYKSNWYGGDYGGISYSFDGTTSQNNIDYGWMVTIPDLGWNIVTDNEAYYISHFGSSRTVEYTESDIENLTREHKNAPIKVDGDTIIQYLNDRKPYQPTVGTIKVTIKQFKENFKAGSYSGYGRIYSPDSGERFEDTIESLSKKLSKLPICEKISLERDKTSDKGNAFIFKFTFMTNVKRADVEDICRKYVEKFVDSNRWDIIQHSKNHYLDPVIGTFHILK